MGANHLLYDRADLDQSAAAALALYVDGELPSATMGSAYEGRLQIHNAVGNCWVELIDGTLPPGSSLVVDNATHEVVVAWPTYSASDIQVSNGDFEAGDAGWILGAGWTIEAKGAQPDVTSGTQAAAYRGNGISYLEGAAYYPLGPTTNLTANLQIQQGGSSAGNVRAAVSLRFYTADKTLITPKAIGTIVKDGSGGEWKLSTMSVPVPGDAVYVRPAIEGNRRRENRPLYADDFTWNLSGVEVGTDHSESIYIRVRVHDAGGRAADWSGVIIVGKGTIATLSPDSINTSRGTLSGGDLTYVDRGIDLIVSAAVTTSAKASGAPYWEITVINGVDSEPRVGYGVMPDMGSGYTKTNSVYIGRDNVETDPGHSPATIPGGASVRGDGLVYDCSTGAAVNSVDVGLPKLYTGDVLRMRFDIVAGKLEAAVNNGAWKVVTATLVPSSFTNAWRAGVSAYYGVFYEEGGTFNLGATAFVYPVPDGYESGWLT